MKSTIVVVMVLMSMTVRAQLPSSNQVQSPDAKPAKIEATSPTVPKMADVNSEVLQLVIQDQWDRGNDMFGSKQIPPPDMHGQTIAERDEQRHSAIRKLLSEGQVKSGTDYWLSALIFQHSSKAEDLMLAHVLAVTAAAKGNPNGKWLAAASLDRYLWTIGQPQVFGTNFKTDAEGKWTNEPYAKETISDAERALWCVVPRAEQEQLLKLVRDGKPLGATGIRECR